MGRPSRRLVVCAGVLVALVALARRTAQRGGERHRRLWHASPRHSVPATALAPDHLRRWVAPRRAAQAWNVTTHGRTTGYRSAANELAWRDGARRGKICATAELPEGEAAAQVWTGYAKRAWRPGGRIAPTPTPEERRALSHFRVEPARSAAFVEPIEPLHGIARHPFARVGCPHSVAHPHDVDLFDITYLVIHNACGRPKPRVLLFDLGASVGFKGVPGGIYAAMPAQGGGLAPSLPLLYRVYADRCLEPDAVFAWEPAPRDARGRWGEERDWWGQLPPDKRARGRFYHDMEDEGQLPATDHPANSLLGVLEAAAVPDVRLVHLHETSVWAEGLGQVDDLFATLVSHGLTPVGRCAGGGVAGRRSIPVVPAPDSSHAVADTGSRRAQKAPVQRAANVV